MNKHQVVMRFVRKTMIVLSTLPLLQTTSCGQVDLQSALTVGLANFTINQVTVAADTIFRNLLGV